MGFRNPIRSAEDLDTGQPTGPGVRLYQDTAGQYPRGVLEFRTGLAGDTPGTLDLTSYQTTAGDGTISSAGNRMRLRGSGANGAPPATLDLNVEGAGAGGYESVARLAAARTVVTGQLDLPRTVRMGGLKPLLGVTGFTTAVTSPTTGFIEVVHNLGVMPLGFSVNPGDGPVRHLADFILFNFDATVANVLVIRRDTNTPFLQNTVTCWWTALVPAT